MKKLLMLMGFGGLIAASTLTLAPQAQATPLSYLQSLNAHGLYVYDTAASLSTGYTICNMLNENTGEVVIPYVFNHTSWSDVPDLGTAATLVVVAVEELCPWHDHRDSGQGFIA